MEIEYFSPRRVGFLGKSGLWDSTGLNLFPGFAPYSLCDVGKSVKALILIPP